jgi:hypothetical protein
MGSVSWLGTEILIGRADSRHCAAKELSGSAIEW